MKNPLEHGLFDVGNYLGDSIGKVKEYASNGFSKLKRNAVKVGLPLALAGYLAVSSACGGSAPTPTPTPTPRPTPTSVIQLQRLTPTLIPTAIPTLAPTPKPTATASPDVALQRNIKSLFTPFEEYKTIKSLIDDANSLSNSFNKFPSWLYPYNLSKEYYGGPNRAILYFHNFCREASKYPSYSELNYLICAANSIRGTTNEKEGIKYNITEIQEKLLGFKKEILESIDIYRQKHEQLAQFGIYDKSVIENDIQGFLEAFSNLEQNLLQTIKYNDPKLFGPIDIIKVMEGINKLRKDSVTISALNYEVHESIRKQTDCKPSSILYNKKNDFRLEITPAREAYLYKSSEGTEVTLPPIEFDADSALLIQACEFAYGGAIYRYPIYIFAYSNPQNLEGQLTYNINKKLVNIDEKETCKGATCLQRIWWRPDDNNLYAFSKKVANYLIIFSPNRDVWERKNEGYANLAISFVNYLSKPRAK